MDRYTEGQISEWDIITGIILDIQIMKVHGGFPVMTWRNVSDASGLNLILVDKKAQSSITGGMVNLFN